MEDSLIRELIHIQNALAEIVPIDLYYKWAEINEEIIDWLKEEEEH